MIDINLLPGEELTKSGPLGKFLIWILSYGRYIIIGTEIIVLTVFLSRFRLDRELTDLHESIAQKQAVIMAASDTEQKIRTIQENLRLIKELGKGRDFPPKIFSVFESLTPNDITLSDLYLDAGKISFTATALSNTSFSDFLNNLSASGSFSDINVENIAKNYKGPGVQFKVAMALNGQ